jgi:GlpG protein
MLCVKWITVKYLPLDQDLSQLTQFLKARGLHFRVSEEQGQQVLAVQDPQLVEPLADLVDEFLQGKVDLPTIDAREPVQQARGISPLATPITLALIVLSIIGALLIETEAGQPFAIWFTFQGVDAQYRLLNLSDTLASGQVWRLLTPVFLHFGLFHVLFNSLWMWDFGRRLELGLGGRRYFYFFLISAVVSNFAQYLWSGAIIFGGMSGVVYALVGFVWIRQRLAPHPLFAVPMSIIGFMLAWLVLCMTGIVDNFIDGSIANAAHAGGLVIGMLLGALSGIRVRAAAQ